MDYDRRFAQIHRELVAELESARTRLAVAIASETKSTPPDRRQYYLETADRMRRFSRRLRKSGIGTLQERKGWILALEALKQLPVQSKAQRLCQVLCDIAEEGDCN